MEETELNKAILPNILKKLADQVVLLAEIKTFMEYLRKYHGQLELQCMFCYKQALEKLEVINSNIFQIRESLKLYNYKI